MQKLGHATERSRQTDTTYPQHTILRVLERVTLGDLVKRYRDNVSTGKRGYEVEVIVLNAFLRHPICRRRLSELQTGDFAVYRDERLKQIKPSTLRRQLAPIHNLFEVARDEWGLPLRENPLAKLSMKASQVDRRERRLKATVFVLTLGALIWGYPSAIAQTPELLQQWIAGIETALGGTVGYLIAALFPRKPV